MIWKESYTKSQNWHFVHDFGSRCIIPLNSVATFVKMGLIMAVLPASQTCCSSVRLCMWRDGDGLWTVKVLFPSTPRCCWRTDGTQGGQLHLSVTPSCPRAERWGTWESGAWILGLLSSEPLGTQWNISSFHICEIRWVSWIFSKIPFQHQVLCIFDQRGVIIETQMVN